MSNERITFHVFDAEGNNQQVGEGTTNDTKAVGDFLLENVTKHHELRVVGEDDATLLHVVNQSLVFPIPEGGTTNNKWDPVQHKFIEQ